MTSLRPHGVHHIALSTTDMKRQLEFWCDAMGLPLKALFWMHGVEGGYHGFVEMSPGNYVSFVQLVGNSDEIEFGVSHANGGAGPIRGGTMQHIAFGVKSFDDILEMRDRLRSKGVQVMGPIDHGFCQSIYFSGPEGLNLEVSTGDQLDARAWIDPEVTGLCGIDAEALEAMKNPEPFTRPAEAVAQPTEIHANDIRAQLDPEGWAKIVAVPDDVIWEHVSYTTPPVAVD